uniref:Uncharacterized protein n=1 Tax=Arundo donax TaxID=35708 RepID=A0A0A9EVH7_ARUDO
MLSFIDNKNRYIFIDYSFRCFFFLQK